MELLNDDQLVMAQIGVLISEFLEPNQVPQSLAEIVEIIYDNLGVEITRGDKLSHIHHHVVTAIQERDELLAIGEMFYSDWRNEDLAEMMAAQIRVEIDREIINDLITEDATLRFDDAMDGV